MQVEQVVDETGKVVSVITHFSWDELIEAVRVCELERAEKKDPSRESERVK